MTAAPIAYEVDARGMRCPWPALRAARAMREHERVLVHADDPIAPKELASLAAEHKWRLQDLGNNQFILERFASAQQQTR